MSLAIDMTLEDAFDKYHQLVYYDAFRLTHSHHTAEDVVQHVFEKLCQREAPFVTHNHLRRWLMKIEKNKCIDILRERKKLEDSIDVSDANLGIDELPIQDVVAVKEAIFMLPEPQFTAFALSCICGYPNREVAEMTGTNENTVKSRVKAARKKIESMVGGV